jgi:hypothetical protein
MRKVAKAKEATKSTKIGTILAAEWPACESNGNQAGIRLGAVVGMSKSEVKVRFSKDSCSLFRVGKGCGLWIAGKDQARGWWDSVSYDLRSQIALEAWRSIDFGSCVP